MLKNVPFILSLTAAITLSSAVPAVAQEKEVVLNPYEGTAWEAGHHKGNFHTHTTESDGSQDPATVIDGYHAQDYNVLAITDHNHLTWPWHDYGRDPEELGMIPVPGNELSRHNHNLSLFSKYPQPLRDGSTDNLHTSLREVSEVGGLNVLAHPGRYWEPGDDRIPDDALAKYLGLFHEYESLIGMEIHNQTDRYPHDRRLWDALLDILMPDRPVWGFANDDSHGEHHIGLNASWFPLEDLSESTVREALETGRFYFSTITTHPEEARSMNRVPKLTGVDYDRETNTITLRAEVAGEPLDDGGYRWISNRGEVVAEGPGIDLDDTKGLTTYLRAELRSDGALSYTQPFGLADK